MEKDVYRQWHEYERDHWWTKGMRYLSKQVIAKDHDNSRDGYILDIGCGTGELTKELSLFGGVIGADFSREALDFCRDRGIKTLVRTSAQKTGFRNNTFSLIVAFCLIEHLEDDRAFLKEMHRILKTDGKLIVLTSAFHFLWSQLDELAHHKRRYTKKELNDIMKESNFHVTKISYANFLLFGPIALVRIFQKLFRVKTQVGNKFVLDVVYTPRFLKNILYKILQIEANMLKYINFPFGVSLLCVGQKK